MTKDIIINMHHPQILYMYIQVADQILYLV